MVCKGHSSSISILPMCQNLIRTKNPQVETESIRTQFVTIDHNNIRKLACFLGWSQIWTAASHTPVTQRSLMTWKFVTMCSCEAQVCQSSNGPHVKLQYTIDVLCFWSNKILRTYQKISISINISQSTAPKIVEPPLLVPKEATTSALRNLLQIHRKAPGASDQGFLVGLGCWQGADLFTTACVLFEEVNTI